MKKFLLSFFSFCVLFASDLFAGNIANVEYIHGVIEKKTGIKIPYSNKLPSPKVAANMEYLLYLVDYTNYLLNDNVKTTNYVDSEYATTVAVDSDTVNKLVDKLVKRKETFNGFTIKTTYNTNSFDFNISAAGSYTIDWGEGKKTEFNKNNTLVKNYSHTYEDMGAYTIKISGGSFAYNNSANTAAISFASNKNIEKIYGSLGTVFGTVADGQQPQFYQTFYNCTNLTGEIPSDLFNGIYGQPVDAMFMDTFSGAYRLNGQIPDRLFAKISGNATENLFSGTFYNCSGLTGNIGKDLFTGITGDPKTGVFYRTFYNCTGLSGIPESLFGKFTGLENWMFYETFYNCTNLKSQSAKVAGKYLYDIWPNATVMQIWNMYGKDKNLSDYECIPKDWGGLGNQCNDN